MCNEIVFDDFGGASTVARIMMESGYVVMLSREDELYVLNYIWSEHCDRNEVVFESREDYDNDLNKLCENIRADCEKQNRNLVIKTNENQKEAVERYLKELARKQRDVI